jgi:UDP-N-acetylglucosamine 2-epimerase (non-hydrolysing)
MPTDTCWSRFTGKRTLIIQHRLAKFVEALNAIPDKYEMQVIWSVHPRTRKQLKHTLPLHPDIKLLEPLGLFGFVRLEKNAFCVLTDSGTVQEECCIFEVPVVTLRNSTERPETLEVGSNFISGCEPEAILRGVEVVTQPYHWHPPEEYQVENVSDTIVKIVLGY